MCRPGAGCAVIQANEAGRGFPSRSSPYDHVPPPGKLDEKFCRPGNLTSEKSSAAG